MYTEKCPVLFICISWGKWLMGGKVRNMRRGDTSIAKDERKFMRSGKRLHKWKEGITKEIPKTPERDAHTLDLVKDLNWRYASGNTFPRMFLPPPHLPLSMIPFLLLCFLPPSFLSSSSSSSPHPLSLSLILKSISWLPNIYVAEGNLEILSLHLSSIGIINIYYQVLFVPFWEINPELCVC